MKCAGPHVRFALMLLTAVAGVACHSQSELLKSRDAGAGSGGIANMAAGSGGSGAGAGGGAGKMDGTAGTDPGDAGNTPDGSPGDVPDGFPGGVPDGSPGGVLVCADYPSHADCTSAPGCETPLGTDTDCASCGDRSCALANTLFSCSSANGCTSAVCAVGFANCDRTSPDCEASVAAGARCLPAYRGSVGYVTILYGSAAAAIATDGSSFFGGAFTGTVTFGTPAAPDVKMVAAPGDIDGFITRFNADGSYAWTRVFPSSGGVDIYGHEAPIAINGLAATADGGVVAVGSYSGTIDLDPGAAVESHQTMGFGHRDSFIVKLAADGSFVWGGTFAGQGIDSSGDAAGVAIDGAGALYVAAWYAGDVDLDPSTGTEVHTSRVSSGEASVAGALVKLTPAGKVSWVQSVDTGACVPPPISITLATDGAIWILGDVGEGGACLAQGASATYGDFIAAYSPSGTPRGYWGFGSDSALLWPYSIAPGSNGSVYIGGGGWGISNFDPGPGVANRLLGTPESGGFIVKLGSDGRYLWAQTLARAEVRAVAGAPDGGVIGLGSGAFGTFVTKLDADGTAGWTFSSGQIPGTVVSSGTSFVVTGSNGNGATDMDPGPGVDMIGAVTLYLSRFNF